MTEFDPTAELFAEINKDYEKPCDTAKIRALIAAGARVDATDERGNTPLHRCIAMGKDAGTAQILIDAKAPLEVKNNELLGPLTYAAWYGRTGIALALIQAGAEVNVTDEKGSSALSLAVNNRHEEIVAAMIAKGADVDALFCDGASPLILAVIHHLPKTVDLLLSKHCNLDVDRGGGDTALALADEMGNPAAIAIRQEMNRREEAEQDRLALLRQQKKEMIDDMGEAMHRGAEQQVPVMSALRLKGLQRRFARVFA